MAASFPVGPSLVLAVMGAPRTLAILFLLAGPVLARPVAPFVRLSADLQDAGAEADAAAKSALKAIDEGVDRRKPDQIVEGLRALEPVWSAIPERTMKSVVKSLGNVFAKFKPRVEYDDTRGGLGQPGAGGIPGLPDDEPIQIEDPHEPLLTAYRPLIGLVFDKPQGKDLLLGALKVPHVKAWPEMVALIVTGLGHRVDSALLPTFAGYLDDPDARVASAAADALGRFTDEPVDLRRKATAALVAAFSDAQKEADKEARKRREDDPSPAADRLGNIHVAFRQALRDLTRQACEEPPEWQAWFDEHGRGSDW